MGEVMSKDVLCYKGIEVLTTWLGYYLGTLDMDDYILKHISVQHKVVVVNVDYR